MDVKTGLPFNGSGIVNCQTDPGSASSSTNNDQNPPTVQSFDRWHEMPEEITFQVMQWMMLNERSTSAPASFVMTSKPFYGVGQAFRLHHLYESAQAILLHPRLVNASRNYLDSLGFRPRFPDTNSPEQLISVLRQLSGNNGEPHPVHCINLGSIEDTTIFDSRVEKALRAYTGKSLSLCNYGNKSINKPFAHIARILPANGDLNLYLYLDLKNLKVKEAVELIGTTCSTGHITSIELLDANQPTNSAEVRQALMNVLCGNGLVSYAVFGNLETTDMLRDLTARFQEIRNLRLLSISCQKTITHADVHALVAAMEQRRASGQSRITVALGLPFVLNPGPDSISFPEEKMLELEGLGLFFGRLEGSEYGQTLFDKVHASLSEGPIGNYITQSRFVPASEAESSESSDLMAEQRPPSQQDAPEVEKKKKDRCVIS